MIILVAKFVCPKASGTTARAKSAGMSLHGAGPRPPAMRALQVSRTPAVMAVSNPSRAQVKHLDAQTCALLPASNQCQWIHVPIPPAMAAAVRSDRAAMVSAGLTAAEVGRTEASQTNRFPT